MADDVYIGNQRGVKFKADVVGGVAIQGVKIVTGDDNTDGGYVKTADGQVRVINQDLGDAIADGYINGASGLNKFGLNETIGTAEETIWSVGGLYVYLASAEILKVSSTDADDDGNPVDTGARTLTIEGLTTGYVAATDTITLNGEGVVSTDVAFIRVFRAYVVDSGSSKTNEGVISIKNNANAVTLAEIAVGRGQTQMAMFTVATGEEFHLKQMVAAESSNKKTIIRMYVRDLTNANAAWRLRAYEMTVNLGSDVVPFPVPIVINGPADIELRGASPVPSGSVQAGFSGYCDTQ